MKRTLRFAVLMSLGTAAFAGVIQVTNSTDLGTNDNVSWSQLGKANAQLPNLFNFVSNTGITGTGRAGPGLSGSDGLIAPNNTPLTANPIYTQYADGPLTLTFNTPVYGVGVLAYNIFGSAYTGVQYHISAFNGTTKLATFDVTPPGVQMQASYLGVLSTLQNITSVVISTDAGPSNTGNGFDLDIVNLRVAAQQPVAGVPEPTSGLLALAGIVSIGICVRRKRS